MSRYDVELVGFVGAPNIGGLARTFDLDEARARALADALPRVIKRGVDEETAERYFHALRGIRAKVRLHRLPAVSEPPSRPGEAATSTVARRSFPPPSAPPAAPLAAVGMASMPAPSSGGAMPLPDFAPPSAPAHPTKTGPAPSGGAEAPPLGEAKGGFLADLIRAYLWPFQLMTPVIVVGVAFFAEVLGIIPFVGPLASTGLMATAVFTVIKDASDGEKGLPTIEFESFGTLALPGVRFLLALFLPPFLILLPVTAAGIASATNMAPAGLVMVGAAPVAYLALAVWLVYLPASLILAAHSQGCLGGLNVIAGVKLIVREPVGYFTMLLAAAPAMAAIGIIGAAEAAVTAMLPVPFVFSFLASCLALLPGFVIGRILGLYIWHFENELGLT